MIDGVWGILCISIPVSDSIVFTIWQYFMFMILIGLILKQLFHKTGGGAKE